jgi:hypothetical protein
VDHMPRGFEEQAGAAYRFPVREAGTKVLFYLLLEVKTELVIQVRFYSPALKQGAQTENDVGDHTEAGPSLSLLQENYTPSLVKVQEECAPEKNPGSLAVAVREPGFSLLTRQNTIRPPN